MMAASLSFPFAYQWLRLPSTQATYSGAGSRWWVVGLAPTYNLRPTTYQSVLPHMDLGAARLELHFDFVHQLVDEVNAAPMFGEDVLGMNGARK